MPGEAFSSVQTSLRSVQTQWTQPSSAVDRVFALQAFMQASATDDTSVDVLSGGDGQDWFLASFTGAPIDDVTDLLPGFDFDLDLDE